MSNAAEFVVRLVDRVTGPAKRAAASLATIDKATKPLRKSAAFKALDKAGSKLWEIGKAGVLAGGVLGVGVAGAFTKASLDAAMFTQNTRLAFEQLTHSAAGGEQAFALVKSTVSDLGVDLHDTADNFRRLLAAQFSIKESEQLVRMGADLSAIGIHGEEVARVLTAISQIKAKGKLQAEEMMQLAEAGISLTLVNGQLQKALGKTATEVDKMKQAGQISGEVGIAAIKAAVKEKLGISEFGDARKKFIDSNLSGMLESLKATSQLLFLRLGDSIAEAAVAMGPLVKDTAEWVRTLDMSSVTEVVKSVLETVKAFIPVGREFLTGFVQGFGALASGLSVSIDASSLQAAADAGRGLAEVIGLILKGARMAANVLAFFTTPLGKVAAGLAFMSIVAVKVVGAISWLSGVWTAAVPIFTTIGSILGTVWTALEAVGLGAAALALAFPLAFAAIVAAVVAAGVAIYVWWDEIKAFFTSTIPQWAAFGWNMVMGLVRGIKSGAGAVWDSVAGLGHTAMSAVKSTLGIASPSKEFAKLGAYSAEGFVQGLEGVNMRSASANAMARPAAAGASAATGGRRGGGAISQNVTIHVDGSKSPAETARAIRDLLVSEMAFAFEAAGSASPAAT